MGLTRDPCIVVSRLRPLLLAAAVLAVSCSSAGDGEAAAEEYAMAGKILRAAANTIPDAKLKRGFMSSPSVVPILAVSDLADTDGGE